MATPNRGTPVKRGMVNNSQTPPFKAPRPSPSPPSFSPSGQPKTLTLQEVKRLTSTPFSNCLTFEAKAIKVEPRRPHWDKRVQHHRQKILFADKTTFLILFMHSEVDEEEDDPKIKEGYTMEVTNFRVVKKGEILIHDRTTAYV